MESGTEAKISECQTGGSLFATGAVIAAAGIGMSRGREGNNTVLKSETAVQDQKPDDAEKYRGTQ